MNSHAAEVEALYATLYARLVGIVGAVTGERSETEEAVQEAFVRLWTSWSTVRRYDDPEAWLLKVAFGKVSNVRRKRRGGVLAWRRHGSAPEVPPPSEVGVDLGRALAGLPLEQRAVLVLRDLGRRGRSRLPLLTRTGGPAGWSCPTRVPFRAGGCGAPPMPRACRTTGACVQQHGLVSGTRVPHTRHRPHGDAPSLRHARA